jgi:acyl carrier protein
MDTLQVIKDVAANQFGLEVAEVDPEAPIEQLGIDSLGFLEFLFELEDRIGVAIPPDSVTGVRTLAELCERVDALLSAAPAVPQSPS